MCSIKYKLNVLFLDHNKTIWTEFYDISNYNISLDTLEPLKWFKITHCAPFSVFFCKIYLFYVLSFFLSIFRSFILSSFILRDNQMD